MSTALTQAPAGIVEQVSKERGYLLRMARQRLHDAAQAEDVVQETLLAGVQAAARFRHQASVRTWLTGILLRRIVDHVRHERRRGRHAAAPAGDEVFVAEPAADEAAGSETGWAGADAAADEPVDWHDPQRLLEGRQLVARVHALLDTLPPQAAQAFVLQQVEGLSTAEVARTLGLDPARGAQLLHRTRTRLRDSLAQH